MTNLTAQSDGIRRGRWSEPDWRRRWLPVLLVWVVLIVAFAVVGILQPGFRSGANIRSLLDQSAILGIVALGQTLVIIARGIDLSVPAMISTAGVLLTRSDGSAASVTFAVIMTILVAVILGLVNGLAIAKLDAPAIVVTLATNTLLFGGLLVVTDGARTQSGGAPPGFFRTLATGRIGEIPVSMLVWIAVASLAVVLMSKTVFGRHLYAIGNNPAAAHFAGVPVARVTVTSYVISALSAAAGGWMLAGYLNQTFPTMGDEYLFTSIAAVIIGGASILGGSGSYLGTAAGCLLLSVLGGVLAIVNLPPAMLRILYGVMILGTVALGLIGSGRKRS